MIDGGCRWINRPVAIAGSRPFFLRPKLFSGSNSSFVLAASWSSAVHSRYTEVRRRRRRRGENASRENSIRQRHRVCTPAAHIGRFVYRTKKIFWKTSGRECSPICVTSYCGCQLLQSRGDFSRSLLNRDLWNRYDLHEARGIKWPRGRVLPSIDRRGPFVVPLPMWCRNNNPQESTLRLHLSIKRNLFETR